MGFFLQAEYGIRYLVRSRGLGDVYKRQVLQDIASFEETQETLALLKILALGNQDVAAGKVKPVADVVARLRAKRATD